jgi:hypothetical protein
MEDKYEKNGITFDSLYDYDDFEVFETKLSNSTSLQIKRFERDIYTPEEKKIIKNEKGEEELKNIPLQSYVRWKYNEHKSKNSNEKELDKLLGLNHNRHILSNAKIVEWSDGSTQLVIGDQYFDIQYSERKNIHFGVTDKVGIIVNKPIQKRMIITPSGENKNEVQAVTDAGKVKLAYNFYNPNEYRKEDYSNNKLSKAKFKEMFEKETGKKRKRSDNFN